MSNHSASDKNFQKELLQANEEVTTKFSTKPPKKKIFQRLSQTTITHNKYFHSTIIIQVTFVIFYSQNLTIII